MASVVPSKSTGTFIAERILAFIREVGCEFGTLTLKSDQEPAMKSIVAEVSKLRAADGKGEEVVRKEVVVHRKESWACKKRTRARAVERIKHGKQ